MGHWTRTDGNSPSVHLCSRSRQYTYRALSAEMRDSWFQSTFGSGYKRSFDVLQDTSLHFTCYDHLRTVFPKHVSEPLCLWATAHRCIPLRQGSYRIPERPVMYFDSLPTHVHFLFFICKIFSVQNESTKSSWPLERCPKTCHHILVTVASCVHCGNEQFL